VLDIGGTNRTFTVNGSSGTSDLLISAEITNGGITKAGMGILTVAAPASYTGQTVISAGTLRMGVNAALSSGSDIVFPASSGTLDLAGFNQNVRSLSGGGVATIALGGANLTISGVDIKSWSGTISGAGAINKAGA